MGEMIHAHMPSRKLIGWFGLGVYSLSFIVPAHSASGDWEFCAGAYAFLYAGVTLGGLLSPSGTFQPDDILRAGALIIAFGSNFTLPFRLRGGWRVGAALAPWFAIAVSESVLWFVPFYPWAIGIGLIHASRALAPGRKVSVVSSPV